MTDKEIVEIVDSGILDDEVMQALECHIGKDKGRCKHCAYTIYGCDCLEKLHFALADLIKRQKAEIERLQQNEKYINTKSGEILIQLDELKQEVLKAFASTKSEAIKEFAERLKTLLYMPDNMVICRTVYTDEIDNLVKEMVGE